MAILLEGISIPAGIYHIHNLAMRNVIVTTSTMSKDEKMEIKEFVNFMGGTYTDVLKETTTHLVTASVRSVKYEVATKNNVSVMHPKWVKDVWEKALISTVRIDASDESFNRFKLPIFYSLCITSTGLTLQDRNSLKSKVEENGGNYSMSFTNAVDILIMEREANMEKNQKFKVAIKLKKFCLTPDWIDQSIEKGYAAPFNDYKIEEVKLAVMKASTPTKKSNLTVSKFNPDSTALSEISRITNFEPNNVSIDETHLGTSARPSARPSAALFSQAEYKTFFEKITLESAKKCDSLLNGYTFYMSGFTMEELRFLGKIVSILGGTKIDEPSNMMTHVIVGASDPKLFNKLNLIDVEPLILSIEWLQTSIEEQNLAEEAQYEIKRQSKGKAGPSNPSPASKKAMKSLTENFKKPSVPKLQLDKRKSPDDELESQLELVNKYLSPPLIVHEPVSLSAEEPSQNETNYDKFLTGKTVFVYGFQHNLNSAEVIDHCEGLGANLVDYTYEKEVDYAITDSTILDTIEPNVTKYKHNVTNLWLVESIEAGKAVDIQFYHKPVAKISEQPLKGEKFVVTNYKGNERNYISLMVEALGGDYSEVLKKVDGPILVTPTAVGRKFDSAQNWGLAVLTANWLIDCINKKRRIDETPFLIGGTSASSRNIKGNDSIIQSSQDPNDCFDPPIENFAEDEPDAPLSTPPRAIPSRLFNSNGTPTTPGSPQLNVSRLLVDMATPQRDCTKAALLEGLKSVISPRKRRLEELVDTPATRARNRAAEKSIPRPELPECMLPPPKDYGIRPESSPNTQWFHKRKLEGLDQNYISRSPQKRSRIEEQNQEQTVSYYITK